MKKEEEKRQVPEGSEENTQHTGKVTERQLRRMMGIQNQWRGTEDCTSKKAGGQRSLKVFIPHHASARMWHYFQLLLRAFTWCVTRHNVRP